MKIRPLEKKDQQWVRDLLAEEWGSSRIVTRGRVHLADKLPGFLAIAEEHPIGLVTYHCEKRECEIVTLNSREANRGTGTALIAAVEEEAVKYRCRRLWLITTNDNCGALRFYQKRGFVLAALYRDAIAESRKLKPEIPLKGLDGISIRDEIEMKKLL